jgi:hypothetical protein
MKNMDRHQPVTTVSFASPSFEEAQALLEEVVEEASGEVEGQFLLLVLGVPSQVEGALHLEME